MVGKTDQIMAEPTVVSLVALREFGWADERDFRMEEPQVALMVERKVLKMGGLWAVQMGMN